MILLNPLLRSVLLSVAWLSLMACSTSPTGRRQLTLLPESQMASMGQQAFSEMKSQTPIEKDPAINSYVNCVAQAITSHVQADDTPSTWEVVVFKDPQVNAFALPGGKIGVYTGLLNVAKTADQLAAVLGHEVGHVIAHHGNARVSESLLAQGGLKALDMILAKRGKNYDYLMAGLGLGAQYGILMPHSRQQESEADLIGLKLMARSGFNPDAAIQLWQNMQQAGGAQPPEFLSTHPSNESRIEDLRDALPEAEALAQKSNANPSCSAQNLHL